MLEKQVPHMCASLSRASEVVPACCSHRPAMQTWRIQGLRKHNAQAPRAWPKPPRIPHAPPRAAPVTGGDRAFLSVSSLSPRWLSALGTAAPSPEQRPIWFRGARFQKCLQTPSLSACSFAAKLATTRWRRCSRSFSSMPIMRCCGLVGSATLVS